MRQRPWNCVEVKLPRREPGHNGRGRQQVSAGCSLVCTIVIVNKDIPRQKKSWGLGGQVGRLKVYRKETNL